MIRFSLNVLICEIVAYMLAFPYALLLLLASIPVCSLVRSRDELWTMTLLGALLLSLAILPFFLVPTARIARGQDVQVSCLLSWPVRFAICASILVAVGIVYAGVVPVYIKGGFAMAFLLFASAYGAPRLWMETVIGKRRKAAEPGATDNPDDAQRLREDH